jgi:hypothetical protein
MPVGLAAIERCVVAPEPPAGAVLVVLAAAALVVVAAAALVVLGAAGWAVLVVLAAAGWAALDVLALLELEPPQAARASARAPALSRAVKGLRVIGAPWIA